MSFNNNLNDKHLSEAQISEVKTTLTTLEKALENFSISLESTDRKRYGSINEQNKLFVNKIRSYAQEQSALRDPDVDWAEFEKDYQSRVFIENILLRLESLTKHLQDAKILHDHDNYQDALQDYAHTSYKAGRGAVGFAKKKTELAQFFSKPKRSK